MWFFFFFFFSSRRRHTRLQGDWSSDVCSSDLPFHYSSYLLYDGRGWGLGGGSFGDGGDQGERLLDFLCGAWAEGLEAAQGCFGVFQGVGEAAGWREQNGDVAACLGSTEEIALPFLQTQRLAVVVQGTVEVAGNAVEDAQLCMGHRLVADSVRRRHF